jgi:hypothetical protein
VCVRSWPLNVNECEVVIIVFGQFFGTGLNVFCSYFCLQMIELFQELSLVHTGYFVCKTFMLNFDKTMCTKVPFIINVKN